MPSGEWALSLQNQEKYRRWSHYLCSVLKRLTTHHIFLFKSTTHQKVGRAGPAAMRSQITLPPNWLLGFQPRLRRHLGGPAHDVRRLRRTAGWGGHQRCTVPEWWWVELSYFHAQVKPQLIFHWHPTHHARTSYCSAGRTDVEGCCWWGRGVIQTSGVWWAFVWWMYASFYMIIYLITVNWSTRFDDTNSNFGKLNYFLGKRAADDGRESRYPDLDFCKDPGECLGWYRIYYFVIDPDVVLTVHSIFSLRFIAEVICSSQEHAELKWIGEIHVYWSGRCTRLLCPSSNGLLLSLVSCHSWILLLDKCSSILWRRRLELYQRAAQLCWWRYGGRCIHQCCVWNRQ